MGLLEICALAEAAVPVHKQYFSHLNQLASH